MVAENISDILTYAFIYLLMNSSPLADANSCATFLVINREAGQLFNPSPDRLAKLDLLHHERCLLCDQEEEPLIICLSHVYWLDKCVTSYRKWGWMP